MTHVDVFKADPTALQIAEQVRQTIIVDIICFLRQVAQCAVEFERSWVRDEFAVDVPRHYPISYSNHTYAHGSLQVRGPISA